MTAPRLPRAEPRQLRASRLIAWLGSLLVLIVLTAGALTAWNIRDLAQEEWREHLASLSLMLAEKTRQDLVSASLVLDGVEQDLAVAKLRDTADLRSRMASEGVHQLLRAAVSSAPHLDVVSIVDANGDVINFSRSFPAPKINLSDRDYFRARRDNPGLGTHVSQPVKNRGSGRWTFYLSRRLEDPAGRFMGLVIVGISCESLSEFYERLRPSTGSRLVLFRDDWTMLTRAPLDDTMIGRRYPNTTLSEALDAAGRGDAGVIVTARERISVPGDRTPRMVAARRVEGLPLVAGLIVEEDVILARWHDALPTIGGVTIASVLGLIGAFTGLHRVQRRREAEHEETLALKERAESANRMKSEFLASMSHELRTPLQGVLGFSELLARNADGPFTRECAQHIESSGRHLLRMLNDILDLAKVEAGMVELRPAEHDLAGLLERIVAVHRAAAQRKGLEMRLDVDASAPDTFTCDATVLEQILNNLLDNAVKFTEQGGVRLAVAASPERLEFKVSDTGPGIPHELHEAIFERFRQGEAFLTRRHGGTGLGLALVRDLVELLGGRVWLDSSPNRGSTFVFELPLARTSG